MGGLWEWDQQAFRTIHEQLRQPWLDPIMRAITITGLGHVQAALLLLALLVWKTHRHVILLAGCSGMFAGILRAVIVRLVDRQRPSNFDFAQPMESVFGNTAFPSGHATGSFAIAGGLFLATRGTRYAWAGWMGLFWAIAVAFSRIYVGVHFVTDVMGGACLGFFAAGLTYVFLWHRLSKPALDSARQD